MPPQEDRADIPSKRPKRKETSSTPGPPGPASVLRMNDLLSCSIRAGGRDPVALDAFGQAEHVVICPGTFGIEMT